MKTFTCPDCGSTLYFDNLVCSCGVEVAFDPDAEVFVRAADPCANRTQIGCNWQSAAGPASLCRACAMTKVVPDSLVATNIPLWSRAEAAKRWVLANLGQWGWFKTTDAGPAPMFHLLSETTSFGHAPVTMGHADGLITINVVEADPAERVARREKLSEAYRTLVGHFRLELGHYVFLRLSEDWTFLEQFRSL
ncbi:MAG: putative zinc-binding metallopeptidase, partial [Henriciella sp.]